MLKKYIGGYRDDGSPWHMHVQSISSLESIPEDQITASLGLISPLEDGNKLIVIKDNKGWDIPGGHKEKGETPNEALIREIKEETNTTLESFSPFAVIPTDKNPLFTTYMILYSGIGKMGPFIPYPNEVYDRAIVTPNNFVDMYVGNKEFLAEILEIYYSHLRQQ